MGVPLQCPMPLRNNSAGSNSEKTLTVNGWEAPISRVLWKQLQRLLRKNLSSAKDIGPVQKAAGPSVKE
jgi:hypothetical protein